MIEITTQEKELKPETKKYPYIGKNSLTDMLVLFLEPGRGVILASSIDSNIGIISDTLIDKYFKPYSESVTLTNAY